MESVKVDMSEHDKKRLAFAAKFDERDMKFDSAKIDIVPGQGLQLVKTYKAEHFPYTRVFVWRSSTDPTMQDRNDELLAEIALIDEGL